MNFVNAIRRNQLRIFKFSSHKHLIKDWWLPVSFLFILLKIKAILFNQNTVS